MHKSILVCFYAPQCKMVISLLHRERATIVNNNNNNNNNKRLSTLTSWVHRDRCRHAVACTAQCMYLGCVACRHCQLLLNLTDCGRLLNAVGGRAFCDANDSSALEPHAETLKTAA